MNKDIDSIDHGIMDDSMDDSMDQWIIHRGEGGRYRNLQAPWTAWISLDQGELSNSRYRFKLTLRQFLCLKKNFGDAFINFRIHRHQYGKHRSTCSVREPFPSVSVLHNAYRQHMQFPHAHQPFPLILSHFASG